jgi:hypothetical protein
VNTQINYATYQTMQEMTKSLKVIIDLLKENAPQEKYPFTK